MYNIATAGENVVMKKKLAVINLGTNIVCATIAKYIGGSKNEIKILGLGYQATHGLEYGRITDISAVEDSIVGSIAIASSSAQERVRSVIVSLPPWAVSSQIIEVSRDINNVAIKRSTLQSIASECIIDNEYTIHIVPINYFLDNETETKNPIGITCKKISAVFNVFSVKKSLLDNIKGCFMRNNIEVSAFVSSALMSSIALCNAGQDKTTIIDIGGSCTTISCIDEGVVIYSDKVPIGCDIITQDISAVLNISKDDAEKIKIIYGMARTDPSEKPLLIPMFDEYGEKNVQPLPLETLNVIVSARLDEILDIIKKHILENNIDEKYYQGILLTGGGSRLIGLVEYINSRSFLIGSSASIGCPQGIIGEDEYSQSASFSATAGSLMYGFGLCQNVGIEFNNIENKSKTSLFNKLKSLFSGEV